MSLTQLDPAFLAVGSNSTPSLDLFFSATKTLDSRITFTRASTGTFINSAGLVESAASGVARFTHDPVTLASLGLLVEESRTNLLLRSEDFGNASWTKNAATPTLPRSTAPDGQTTADNIIPSTASGSHNLLQFVNKAASSITYTMSLFAKANGYSFVGFRLDDGGANGAYACFDVSNGTVSTAATTTGTGFSSASASVISFTNGWKRVTLTFTSNTGTTIRPVITVQDATGNPFTYSFTGNGTSGVLFWGAQLETGSFSTSYIATDGTAGGKTRAAEDIVMTGTNFSTWYSTTESTVVTDYIVYGTSTSLSPSFSIDGGSIANEFLLGRNSSGQLFWTMDTASSNQGNASVGSFALNTLVKAAYSAKANDIVIALSGSIVSTDLSANMPTVDRLRIGSEPQGRYANGAISRIRYYRRRINNAGLQSLTT